MIRSEQHDLFAVIGNPAGHSLSPAMMNAAFRALDIPAVYLALTVDDVGEGLAALAALGFKGIAVTIPHKQEVMRRVDRVGTIARDVGAVNTLRYRNGLWEGHNTDWIGVVRALEEAGAGHPAGRNAAVIGAGGAARAAVYGLKREGAAVTVINRTVESGEALARELECDFLPQADAGETRFDLAVQTTPVGMEGMAPGSPVPESFFHADMTVLDAVYRPLETEFLRFARRAGARTATGLDMLLLQGVAQFEWWLARPAPVKIMKAALEKELAHEQAH